jgi:hypothetical protein
MTKYTNICAIAPLIGTPSYCSRSENLTHACPYNSKVSSRGDQLHATTPDQREVGMRYCLMGDPGAEESGAQGTHSQADSDPDGSPWLARLEQCQTAGGHNHSMLQLGGALTSLNLVVCERKWDGFVA